jgi:hypothetical protein
MLNQPWFIKITPSFPLVVLGIESRAFRKYHWATSPAQITPIWMYYFIFY